MLTSAQPLWPANLTAGKLGVSFVFESATSGVDECGNTYSSFSSHYIHCSIRPMYSFFYTFAVPVFKVMVGGATFKPRRLDYFFRVWIDHDDVRHCQLGKQLNAFLAQVCMH